MITGDENEITAISLSLRAKPSRAWQPSANNIRKTAIWWVINWRLPRCARNDIFFSYIAGASAALWFACHVESKAKHPAGEVIITKRYINTICHHIFKCFCKWTYRFCMAHRIILKINTVRLAAKNIQNLQNCLCHSAFIAESGIKKAWIPAWVYASGKVMTSLPLHERIFRDIYQASSIRKNTCR